MVVGIVSDLVAMSVPDVSMVMTFVPDFAFEPHEPGDEPTVGGQIVLVHTAKVRSKPPVCEAVTCSCHICRAIGQIIENTMRSNNLT